MNITGGTISYEHGVKGAQDYEPPKKAKVELRFDIAEDLKADAEAVEAYVAKVADAAKAKVYEMLGGTAPAKAAVRAKPVPTPEQLANDAAVQPHPSVPKGKTKKDLEAEQNAALKAHAEANKPKPDPASMEDLATVPPAAKAVDPMDELTTVAADPISDATLNKAVQVKHQETGDAVAIRAVISTFNPDPAKQFTLAQIPQAERQTFLDKLAELKKK